MSVAIHWCCSLLKISHIQGRMRDSLCLTYFCILKGFNVFYFILLSTWHFHTEPFTLTSLLTITQSHTLSLSPLLFTLSHSNSYLLFHPFPLSLTLSLIWAFSPSFSYFHTSHSLTPHKLMHANTLTFIDGLMIIEIHVCPIHLL